MSSGTRLVFGFVLFAAVVFAALEFYGTRSIARRDPETPVSAARAALQADNTVVGLIGGIGSFEPIDVQHPDAESAYLEAKVDGTLGSGLFVAELGVDDDGLWVVRTASFTLSDGTRIPVSGPNRR